MIRVIHKPWMPYAKPFLDLRIAEILANRLAAHCASVKVKRTGFGGFQIFVRGKK